MAEEKKYIQGLSKTLARSETQLASTRIWAWVAGSISNDVNRYTELT